MSDSPHLSCSASIVGRLLESCRAQMAFAHIWRIWDSLEWRLYTASTLHPSQPARNLTLGWDRRSVLLLLGSPSPLGYMEVDTNPSLCMHWVSRSQCRCTNSLPSFSPTQLCYTMGPGLGRHIAPTLTSPSHALRPLLPLVGEFLWTFPWMVYCLWPI